MMVQCAEKLFQSWTVYEDTSMNYTKAFDLLHVQCVTKIMAVVIIWIGIWKPMILKIRKRNLILSLIGLLEVFWSQKMVRFWNISMASLIKIWFNFLLIRPRNQKSHQKEAERYSRRRKENLSVGPWWWYSLRKNFHKIWQSEKACFRGT